MAGDGEDQLEAKRRRRELAKQLHPDTGGDANAFVEAFQRQGPPRLHPMNFGRPSRVGRYRRKLSRLFRKHRRRRFTTVD